MAKTRGERLDSLEIKIDNAENVQSYQTSSGNQVIKGTLFRLYEERDRILDKINSYGRNLHQRGLRANKDEIVESKTGYYISQHCLGKAADFHVVGMTIREVYDHILNNRELYPYIKRIENISKTPTWIHIDVANTESNDITIF